MNSILVHAASALAPAGVTVSVYDGIGGLPHFNPDREDEVIDSVIHWRAQLKSAEGALIAAPEYAHGIPGVLKNALDWVVGSGELVGKPVALFNASPYSRHAQESLKEILTTMDARVIAEASITLPLRGKKMDVAGLVNDADFALPIRAALDALSHAILRQKET